MSLAFVIQEKNINIVVALYKKINIKATNDKTRPPSK